MKFTVEVLLKGREDVVSQALQHDTAPGAWTDEDVRELLHLTLREFERALNPDAGERPAIHLRGFNWIVTPVDGGVGIAIEMASGTVVSGPFDVDVEWLTAAITRVMTAQQAQPSGSVH